MKGPKLAEYLYRITPNTMVVDCFYLIDLDLLIITDH